jgi:uncharacterized protein with ParB-like and HNH nuclease domain
MEAGKRTINDIFNGNRVLEIPFFQRSYVWGEEQWERLLTDMENVSKSNKPYFLGSVILKQQPTNTQKNVGDIRTVVDGQQRMTTLNIFFKVLCLKTNTNPSFERVFKLISNDIALLHNHNDIESFNRILNLTSEDLLDETDEITKAYNYFRQNADVDVLDFQKILSNIMFVGIDLGQDEDEQQIFDTINSLGVRLTTAELLKNYFFGRDEIQYYIDYWRELFEKDNETKNFWDKEITTGRTKRNNIDLFFYSFLQIKVQDDKLNVKTEDKNEFTKVEGLFDSYKKFISEYGVDKKALVSEIRDYAAIYSEGFDFDIVDSEITEKHGIERINAIIFGLENTTLIPYVLFVLKNVSDTSQRENLFEYLESYLIRRMITHANTKNYNQLFSERLIANQVLTKEEFKDYIDSQSDKVNYMPTDAEVKDGFNNSKLVNKQAAGILYLMESKIRNRASHSTSLLGLNRYSLEHIMPKKWENHWNNSLSQEEKIIRNRSLLTLGNLAIITSSLNSSIRDSTWDTKKNGRGDKKGLKHYSAGLETLGDFLDEAEWNETTIQNRADYLSEKAIEIWKS